MVFLNSQFCREENELIDYLKDKVKVLEAQIERDPDDDWSIGMKIDLDTHIRQSYR